MNSLPVGIRLCVKQLASLSAEDSNDFVAPIVLAVFWTAGVRSLSRPPSSLGETSAVAWAIHGSASWIVGPSCLTPGSSSRANCCVGPNEASSAVSADCVRRSNGGSSAIVWLRSCCREASVAIVALNV